MPARYRKLRVILALLASPILLAHAQEGSDEGYSAAYSQCMDKSDGITTNMVACISAEFERQDLRLNQNYKAALKTLSPAKQKQLRDTQRIWIQFRDAECGFQRDLTGGTIDRINGSSCMMELTKTRADDLAGLSETF